VVLAAVVGAGVLEAAVVDGVLLLPQAASASTSAAPSVSVTTIGPKPLTPALTASHGSPAVTRAATLPSA
jgi:hypothetical protein